MSLIGTPAPVPAELWDLLDSEVLAGGAAAVTFTGLAAEGNAYRVTGFILRDANAGSAQIILNNDTAGNYAEQRLEGDGASLNASRTSPATYLVQTESIAANESARLSVLVSKPATGVAGQGLLQSGQGDAGSINLNANAGAWTNAAALITRIDVVSSANQFAANTSVMVEGAAA
jgi:hypothetical protein